ncbi:MAG: EAL domain-containing protein [Herminiimonas sp.]|nr:EAL domain-containing protein [Herminiimonas sp.]
MITASDIFNARILVVDDQTTQVLILQQMLRNAGYAAVTGVTDPYAVCGMHQEQMFDLILLDLKMPGLNGFEVIDLLKTIEKEDYLPVLAITTDNDLKLDALQAGAKDFISRPYNLVEVLSRIRNMLEVRLLHTMVKNQSRVLEETVQKRTKDLFQSETRFRSFTAMSSDWYWEQGADFRFTMISGTTVASGERTAQFLDKARWEDAASIEGNDWEAHRAVLEAHQPFCDFEYKFRHPDGAIGWRCINGAPLFNQDGSFSGYRGTGKDITLRKQDDEHNHYRALHDELTGLPNRALLIDRLDQTLGLSGRNGNPVWVLLIDIDRFKFVNDSLGHKAGDRAIQVIAQRLQEATRQTDTIARLSGDEFVLVLPLAVGQSIVTDTIDRLLKAVSEPFTIDAHEFFLTCSIGVAAFPADGAESEALIDHADTAMYRAKEMGGNAFQFYTAQMNARSLERLSLEMDLRLAIERQEFVLHYQPQVNLQTGQVVGMEALVRWQHASLGLISPNRFIGLAEETGMIGLIGAWVLRTACAQTRRWLEAGHAGLRIAVNLSARQFAQPDLVQSIALTLAETGLQPEYLELELTEGVLMHDVEVAIDTMHKIKQLGVHISIDDFGTGYSSLAYLKRFPIDVLKIDRSFINEMTFDSNDAVIVKSVIALAHNLNLQVVAEGVETHEQLAYLQSLRCDMMQGYFFSKPVSASDFETILRANLRLPLAHSGFLND